MFSRQHGFSIVELMIAIGIMSILIMLGLPSFNTYLENVKLRSSAEAFLAGLQLARGDAVRRNAGVQFLLTDDAPIAANKDTVTAAANGANWMIRTADIPATFIEGKFGVEASSRAQGSASPVIINSGGVTMIAFNGLGGATPAATFQFTNPNGGSCAPAGPMRCLNVVVSTGGRIRMCDPAVTAAQIAAGDTRGC